ncbi:MAG: DNA-3-methyladenine glycosylase [archaeon]|nr:DNA-3-methyladenine glycosylase [archaeon]
MKEIPISFFAQDTLNVAKNLLGKVISVNGFLARIVETEAYCDDAASHARTKTERSKIMHDTYGYSYIYLIYGMYHCLNFTTSKGPGAVLIRAVEPLNRIDELKLIRKTNDEKNLCSGPGKLCQAFGINKTFNELKLGTKIGVFDDGFVPAKMGKSSRVGITEAIDLEWRFYIESNKFVSKAKFNK